MLFYLQISIFNTIIWIYFTDYYVLDKKNHLLNLHTGPEFLLYTLVRSLVERKKIKITLSSLLICPQYNAMRLRNWPNFHLTKLFCIFLSLIKIFKLKLKHLSKKTRLKWFQCNHMILIHSILSRFLLPFPLKPKYITPPNETVTCVCVCRFDITCKYTYTINWNGNTHLCV